MPTVEKDSIIDFGVESTRMKIPEILSRAIMDFLRKMKNTKENLKK